VQFLEHNLTGSYFATFGQIAATKWQTMCWPYKLH